jgi:thiamine biosynthesis lipoprotein
MDANTRPMSGPHVFHHEAMKTTFTLRLISEDESLARNAANAAIELINTIENTLSRYIEGSDVWQINHMPSGETLFLTDHCDQCLRMALTVGSESEGLFDITLGRQIEHQKNKIDAPRPQLEGQLMLDPDRPAIHCIEAGREIDLGGIGKGYALDQIKALAQDWGISAALLSAGASTQLAYGDRTWPITLQGEHSTLVIDLQNQSLSVSGIDIQGNHIVAPDNSPLQYAYPRIWLSTSLATKADAYSTAALMMNREQLQALSTYLSVIYVETETGIKAISI